MDETAKQALRDSISHWERLAAGEKNPDEGTGSDDCPLCQKYLDYRGCLKCPVQLYTGKSMCDDTPWRRARTAGWNRSVEPYRFRQAADDMCEFLQTVYEENK